MSFRGGGGGGGDRAGSSFGGGNRGRGRGARGRGKPKNNFWAFAEEFRAKQEKLGVLYSSSELLSQAASPHWQKLTADEKAAYAKITQGCNSEGKKEKYTSTGESLSEIQRANEEKKLALETEKTNIESIIDETFADNTLVNHQFFIVNTNYFCETGNGIFVTCEVGAAIFCLKLGVITTYHAMVEAPIPLGYAFDAQARSKLIGIETPFPGPTKNRLRVMSELIGLLNTMPNSHIIGTYPPLFAMPDDVAPVSNFLQQMCDEAGKENMFLVYSLPYLFQKIRNTIKTTGDIGFPALPIAYEQLKVDKFSYHRGLSCKSHNDNDLYPECSLARVKRMCFTICDHCCKCLKVKLIPGRHIPTDIDPIGSSRAMSFIETGPSRSIASEMSTLHDSSRWSDLDAASIPDDDN